MQTATVGSILEAISVLDPDDQLFVTEVLKKRAIAPNQNQQPAIALSFPQHKAIAPQLKINKQRSPFHLPIKKAIAPIKYQQTAIAPFIPPITKRSPPIKYQ